MRNDKGQFIKGYGFWSGKKRPGLKTSTSFKKGDVPWNKDKKGWRAGEAHPWKVGQVPVSAFKPGQNPWNKDKEWKEMQRENHPMWGKQRVDIQGKNNPNWKGGTTLEREQARKSIEYKQWRLAVFKRDKFTCQDCARSKEVHSTLQADHIKPWSLFPELRYDIDNGRTLCCECHSKTYSYLNNSMNRGQFL